MYLFIVIIFQICEKGKETTAAQHRSRNKLGYKVKNLSDHI